jgi:hypothetical protein
VIHCVIDLADEDTKMNWRATVLQMVRVSIVGLVILFGSKEQVGSSSASFAISSTTVILSGARVRQSSPAAADFDGDGDKEIVIGGEDGRLYVLAREGSTWSVVWSKQTADDLNAAGAPAQGCVTDKSDIRSSPAIGDLDHDGHLEIVITVGGDPANHRNGGVLVYRYNSRWSFSLVSGWPQPRLDIVGSGPGASNPDGCWDGIWASPALGDLDGDGDLEIAVEGFDRRLHVWHHNGTYVQGWPIAPPRIYRGGWATPAIADIDRDGLPEVIFATDNNPGYVPPFYLYAFNGDGTVLPGFPVEASQNLQSSPAIGDVDGDGWLDIVVGTGTYQSSGGNKVYAWNHMGQPLQGWPAMTGGNMPASPALGDLDGDGDLEIVVGCGSEGDAYPAPCTTLYAWHGDGTSVNGFPISPARNDGWGGEQYNSLPYSPVLADYDGDGEVEILIVSRWSWGISTVERVNGVWKTNNNPLLRTTNTLESSPLVDDVDGDDSLDIVIGGANSQEDHGVVYIWKMEGRRTDALPWPMFHRDVARTGYYPRPPRLVFPAEIRVFHQYGSEDTEIAYAMVQNAGDGEFEWRIAEDMERVQVTPVSGTVTNMFQVQLTITTTGLVSGWHSLGTLNVSGHVGGVAVSGSPVQSSLHLFVGDVSRSYLPMVLRQR